MDAPDQPLPPEVLLAHAEWVRALARRLLRDDALADDVVQETWLAALRRPPRGVRDPAAWLATVVRNLARRALRTRTRDEVRERGAAPPTPPPTPAEILEQEAMRRRVVEAVLALDDPYRATLLLRYYEDLAPAEIARRLDVPPGTVRTRLKRALALLRERLAADAPARDGTSSLHAGLAVLARWAVPSLPGSGVAATTGGLVMSAKPVLAVSALVVAVATTIYVVHDPETAPPQSAGENELVMVGSPDDAAGGRTGEVLPAESEAATKERPARETGSSRRSLGFVLEVRYADGTPAAESKVVLFRDEVLAVGVTNELGVVELPVTGGACEMAIASEEAPLFRKAIHTDGSPRTIDLEEGAEVSGWMTVNGGPPDEEVALQLEPDFGWVDADWLPLPVWEALGQRYDDPRSTMTTVDGVFRFPGLPPEWRGGWIRAPAGRFQPRARDADGSLAVPATAGPPPEVAGPVEGIVIEYFRMLRLRGRVVQAGTGAPAPSASIGLNVCPRPGSRGLGYYGEADEDGRFEFSLEPADAQTELILEISTSDAGERRFPLSALAPDAHGVCDLGDFPLGVVRDLRFLVLDEDETPIEGAFARFWKEGARRPTASQAPTDTTGITSLLVDVPLGRLHVQAPGYRTAEVTVEEPVPDPIVVQLVPGTTLVVTLHPAPDSLPPETQIEIRSREPLFPATGGWQPGWGNVVFRGKATTSSSGEEEWSYVRSYPDAEGRLGYSDVRAGTPLVVRVIDERGFAACTVDVPPLEEEEYREIDVEVPDVARTFRGVVVDAAGELVPGAGVTLAVAKRNVRSTVGTGKDGTFAIHGFLPDRAILQVMSEGTPPLLVADYELPRSNQEVTLRLPAPRPVRVIVADDRGRPAEDVRVDVEAEGFRLWFHEFSIRTIEPGIYEMEDLPPGFVELVVRHGGRSVRKRHDTSLPEVRVTVSPWSPVVVAVETDLDPKTIEGRIVVALTPRGEEAQVLWQRVDTTGPRPWRARFPAVAVGDWELVAQQDLNDGRGAEPLCAPLSLTVPADEDSVLATLRF